MEKNRNYVSCLIGDILIAAMIGVGLMMLSAGYIGMDVTPSKVYSAALISVIALFGLSYSRASGWITFFMLILAALIGVVFGWEPVEQTKMMIDAVTEGAPLDIYFDTFAVLGYILLATCAYTLVRHESGAQAIFVFLLLIMVIGWVFGDFSTDPHLFLLLSGIGALFAKSTRFRFTVIRPLISFTLVAALLAMWLVPTGDVSVPALKAYGEKALKTVMRLLSIDDNDLEERRSFTIVSGGWLTHKEILGGNANPSEDGVMYIRSGEDEMYLRGAIRYVYNNKAWVDESNESKAGKIKRYMFSGIDRLIYKSEYEKAFDLDKSAAESYMQKASAQIEVISDSNYWTMFTPDRVTDVEVSDGSAVYYNNVGEMFLNRSMKAGDRYTVEFNRLKDNTDIKNMLSSLSKKEDPGYKTALVMNRDVPSGIDARIYELVSRITANALSPYEKAEAIRDYLKYNGTYTLKTDYTPEDEDAVSFFILNGMKGYCAHYASAMALMARIAGLPARYVEGYLAETDENGQALVTGKDAHAWAEVYFEGYGWMTFDATPADGNQTDDESGDENSGSESNTQNENMPEPTPTPAPTPAPTPIPETPVTTPAPQEEMTHESTPTPPPFDEITPSPTRDPGRNRDIADDPADKNGNMNDENDGAWGIVLLIALIILSAVLFMLFLLWRLYRTRPETVTGKAENEEDRLMGWYRAMLTALEVFGIRYENGETPVSYAKRALEAEACDEAFEAFAMLVSECMYAERIADETVYDTAKTAYSGIVSRMSAARKLVWRVKRIIRGIGRLHPVP